MVEKMSGGGWIMANVAERFISFLKRNDFDYTVWQREYFDKMKLGEFGAKASAYAKSHPYAGKAQIL